MHALVHVTDTVAGRLSTSHWAIDFPGVYLPTIISSDLRPRRRRESARRGGDRASARDRLWMALGLVLAAIPFVHFPLGAVRARALLGRN